MIVMHIAIIIVIIVILFVVNRVEVIAVCHLGLEVNIKVWNVLLDQGVQLEGEDECDDDADDDDDHLEKMIVKLVMSHH